jgi:uncharacterized protein
MLRPRLIVLQPTAYCNINCSYCYLSHRDDRRLMPMAVIDGVREKIFRKLAPDAAPSVVWHAGEPTMAPIEWYDDAYARLIDVSPPNTSFAMQSNGLAIDGKWIDFFRRTRTDVGLSIDGPRRFHDARRRTRNNKPTWQLAVRALERLQDAGFYPNVISVLHPDGLKCPDEYYEFYRQHGITRVNFSIDELEGANLNCSFGDKDYKQALMDFVVALLEQAYREDFPLHIIEVERIAQILTSNGLPPQNEQVAPWDIIVVAADGSLSTFSPEFMEIRSPMHGDFVFGNILTGDIEDFNDDEVLQKTCAEIAAGVAACRSSCKYFGVCGGGAPVNKLCEKQTLTATETMFCRLSVQALADALMTFLTNQQADQSPEAHCNLASAIQPLKSLRS